MQLVYQYMAIFFDFSTTSYHLHQLQVGNCDSNWRIAVDEDDYDKFRPERVKASKSDVFPAALRRAMWRPDTNISVDCSEKNDKIVSGKYTVQVFYAY